MTLQELFGNELNYANFDAVAFPLDPSDRYPGAREMISLQDQWLSTRTGETPFSIIRDAHERIVSTSDVRNFVTVYDYEDLQQFHFITQIFSSKYGHLLYNKQTATYNKVRANEQGNGGLEPVWSSVQLDQSNGSLTVFDVDNLRVSTTRLDGSGFSWTDEQLPGKLLFVMNSYTSSGLGFSKAQGEDGSFTLSVMFPDAAAEYVHVDEHEQILSDRNDAAINAGVVNFSSREGQRISFDSQSNTLTVIDCDRTIKIDQCGQYCD